MRLGSYLYGLYISIMGLCSDIYTGTWSVAQTTPPAPPYCVLDQLFCDLYPHNFFYRGILIDNVVQNISAADTWSLSCSTLDTDT